MDRGSADLTAIPPPLHVCRAIWQMITRTEQLGSNSNRRQAQLAALQKQERFGTASCDSCHTRCTFSVKEAKSPQACETCHMGFDHPQWEMYSSSKHGVRNELKQLA